jgi:hypothetical protein
VDWSERILAEHRRINDQVAASPLLEVVRALLMWPLIRVVGTS